MSTINNNWDSNFYKKIIAERFKVMFNREHTNEKELLAYAITSFFLDQSTPGNQALKVLTGYAAANMRLLMPDDAKELDTITVVECLIESFAQIVQIGVRERVHAEEAKKQQQEELQKQLDKTKIEALGEQLNDLFLKRN